MKIALSQINELLEKPVSAKEVEEAFSFYAFEVEEVAEVDEDTVFDVDVLPNRSSDALSVLGLARELSAILDIPLKKDELLEDAPNFDESSSNKLQTQIEDNSSASLYIAALIEGVKVKESPKWLQDFLLKVGQKPINNLVDATNYVLFYLGQPTHVFDADTLSFKDGYKLGVRPAKEKEEFISLDDKSYTLDETVSVIFDANDPNQKALAIAGVKGGKNSGTNDETTNIILESARFDPILTRKSAQKMMLQTDASKRFENDIPNLLPYYGMKKLIDLILDIAGGSIKSVSVSGVGQPKENPWIKFNQDKLDKIIGFHIEKEDAFGFLKRLRFNISEDTAQAPHFRTDINIFEDVAEEVLRLYGLQNLPKKQIPNIDKKPEIYKPYYYSEKLREFALNHGFIEVTNSSLQDKGELKLKNALASDKNHFRDDLKYALEKTLDKNEKNAPLLGIYDFIKVFEIGAVYKNGREFLSAAFSVRSIAKKKREQKAKLELEKIKLELEKEFDVSLPEVVSEVFEFELETLFKDDLPESYPELPTLPAIKYEPFSVYPFVLRDVAIWLPKNTNAQELEKLIKEFGGSILVRIDKFDEFEKDERVSHAYHLVFQAPDRTLTDEEVNTIMQKIEEQAKNLGWEPR